MFQSIFRRLGYQPSVPGTVILSVEEAEVICDALQVYYEATRERAHGYFAEASNRALAKVRPVHSSLYQLALTRGRVMQ